MEMEMETNARQASGWNGRKKVQKAWGASEWSKKCLHDRKSEVRLLNPLPSEYWQIYEL